MTASLETYILVEPGTARNFCFRHPDDQVLAAGGAGKVQTMVADLHPDRNAIEHAV